MKLIENIETLRKYAKINASTHWDTISTYVMDAQEKYITPYFGEPLLEAIGNDNDELRDRILRALGPFSLALATHELSINLGEAGHTVTRTSTLAPASDTKIEKATHSLLERGWHNLDRAIRYLHEKREDYPAYEEGNYYRQIKTKLFADFVEFQENGLIDINYSPLTFMRLRMLILRIEKSETLVMLPPDYEYATHSKLLGAMQAYTASRVAELQTNADREHNLKDAPPIELLHEGGPDTKNYYATQSNYWRNEITDLLIKDNVVQDSREVKVNDYDRTIFFAGGNRVDN